MRTLIEVLNLSVDFLKQKGISSARRQAEDLISDALGIKRMQIYVDHERPMTPQEIDLLRVRLARRGKGEPNPYIHGSVEFYACAIKVTPDVLIPRQETEILVDKIAKELATMELQGKELWDLCTGSGCIGIALKKRFPELKVVLSDKSSKALEVARQNALDNGVDVELVEGDLLNPLEGRKADFVVCNPPYIAEKELESLDTEVRNFEPLTALISGKTGLEFYARLANELKDYLNPSAKVWFEIGAGQGEALKTLFANPPWNSCGKNPRVENDWSGKERFFFLEIE